MAVEAIAGAFGGISIDSGNQDSCVRGMAGGAGFCLVNTRGTVGLFMAGDARGGGQDIRNIMVNRSLVIKESGFVLGVTASAGVRAPGSIAKDAADQYPGGLGMTGGAIVGFVDADSPVGLIVASHTLGGCL